VVRCGGATVLTSQPTVLISPVRSAAAARCWLPKGGKIFREIRSKLGTIPPTRPMAPRILEDVTQFIDWRRVPRRVGGAGPHQALIGHRPAGENFGGRGATTIHRPHPEGRPKGAAASADAVLRPV